MTPHANPIPNSPEHRFNVALACARNTIERAIGLLKTRFRCLLKERVARYDPTFVGNLVNACVTLHNICLDFGVNIDEDMEINFDNEPNQVLVLHNQDHGGILEGQREIILPLIISIIEKYNVPIINIVPIRIIYNLLKVIFPFLQILI